MLDQLTGNSQSAAAIYLDYGADSAECDQDFKVCDRGMCFKSNWRFEPGTQLSVVLSYHDETGQHRRMDTEATVATCEPIGPRCFQVIALFVDLPEDRHEEMRRIGKRLDQRPQITAAVEA